MTTFLLVLLIGAVAAVPVALAGWLAERVSVPSTVLSAAWQVAAGMILAIVGFSLMPTVVRVAPPLPVLLAFFAGGALFVLVDYLVSQRQPAASRAAPQSRSASLFVGVLVDLAIDGVVIGVGSTLSLGAGLALALGMAVSTAPLAFVSIATARSQGIPPASRRQYAMGFGFVVLAGAALGYLVFRDQSETVRQLLIAAASGFLITLVTQTMIPEALREAEARLAGLYFVGGLSAYALLTLTLK
jgi:ZIP family zinc transporter